MIIFLAIGGFFALAIGLAAAVVMQQGRAKSQALDMLESGQIDRKKAKGILRTLSQCKDNEGRRLYEQLAEKVEVHKKNKPILITRRP